MVWLTGTIRTKLIWATVYRAFRLRFLNVLLWSVATLAMVCAVPCLHADHNIPTDVGRLQRAITEKQASAGTSPQHQLTHAMARLALKKSRLYLQRGQLLTAACEARNGLEILSGLENGETYLPPKGKLTELAYVSEVDESVQPFYVHVPPDYDPGKPCPLIVFLHGYLPEITVLEPWKLPEDICDIAADVGAILVIPYGRRNTDFQGVGEQDVFAVIRWMQKLFTIDRRRIHLSGHSMGGYGAWTIALRHPGLFASVTPMSSQTDMARWHGWNLQDLPSFKRFLIRWDNPQFLASNARGQHIFVQHGIDDEIIPINESRSMVDALRQEGIQPEYRELPGDHFIHQKPDCYINAWRWANRQVLEDRPSHVSFTACTLAHNRAFWVTIEQLRRWGLVGHVNIQCSDNGPMSVMSSNVDRLAIDSAKCPQRLENGAYSLVVNGHDMVAPVGPDGRATIELGSGEPAKDVWPLVKRNGLCGPVEDAFRSRFVVVKGTGGSELQSEHIEHNVKIWLKQWHNYADGEAICRADHEVSAEEIQSSNLILFGTPETNSVLGSCAERLPIEISDQRYELLGKTYEGASYGLVLCYPNPLNPRRYIVVYSGELYGQKLPPNKLCEMLPDVLIFTTQQQGVGGTDKAICGGWFDRNWHSTTIINTTRNHIAGSTPASQEPASCTGFWRGVHWQLCFPQTAQGSISPLSPTEALDSIPNPV